MQISQEEMNNGVLKVTLKGSLDIDGAGEVDGPFSDIGGSREKVIVDLTNLDFLASVGIRIFVRTAKAMHPRGGKVALINPNDTAKRIMHTTGLDTIVSVVDNEDLAIAAVS